MTKQFLVQPGTDSTIGGPSGTALSAGTLTYTTNVPSLLEVVVAQPTAGTDWSLTVPATSGQTLGGLHGPLWLRLASGFVILTTSAAVANRFPGVVFKDAGSVIRGRYMQQGNAWTASLVGKLGYARTDKWVQAGNLVNGTTESQVGMPPFVLLPGYILGSITGGLDVADQYSAINLFFEVWTSQPVFDVPGPML